MFNIDEYINSLPINTKCINVQLKNITYLPDLTRFYKLKYLFCDFNFLTELPPLPDSLCVLYCNDNQLSYLPILPKKLKYLRANHNNISIMPPFFPNNIKIISLQGNYITDLPYLPPSLKVLFTIGNNTCLEDIDDWRIFQKKRFEHFSKKYSEKLERFYVKHVRNKKISTELLYSPDLPFYKQFVDTLSFFSNS